MKKKQEIYLFRHGKTNYNEKGIFTGWKDSKLTNNGKKDAQKIAEKLKNKKIDIAIQTKLSRSKETLDIVLKYHPECKKIIIDNRIIERSYGILEGISHKSFIKKVGEEEYKLLKKSGGIEKIKSKTEIEKIKKFLGEKEYEAIHRGYYTKAINGESFYDVEKRVNKFINWLKSYLKKNKVNVAISAHGNSIRLFRKIIENQSKEKAISWIIPYDKVFIYKI